MSPTLSQTRQLRQAPVWLAGLAAAAGYALTAVASPHAAAGGWLIAFLFWSGISIGSITALMIHRLTGGAWGRAFAPAFWDAAAAIPFVALLFIPILALLPDLYPWATGAAGVKPDVARWYLDVPWFFIRSAVAFGGWTAIMVALSWRGWPGTLVAAIGLAFHGLMIGAVGLDWIQSIEPPFFSTSFGASLAVTQLIAAFAVAAVLAPANEPSPAVSDLGGMLLATVLGLLYIDFMAFLVIWYGNLPHKIAWFVRREPLPWPILAVAMFVLTCVVPVVSLLFAHVRASPAALRGVGVVVLAGLALYYGWLVGPAYGVLSLLAATFAVVAIGAVAVALSTRGWTPALLRPRGAAHVD